MNTVKEYLNSPETYKDINEAVRNRTIKSIKNYTNITLQKIQRTDDVIILLKLQTDLLQLLIELSLKGK